MIIDPEATYRQVRGEQESLYLPETGKRHLMDILETLVKYHIEGSFI